MIQLTIAFEIVALVHHFQLLNHDIFFIWESIAIYTSAVVLSVYIVGSSIFNASFKSRVFSKSYF
jgi:hypothetical protein